ncbi:hypothetical protein NY547_13470 [Cnuibacter physcomitrellae]|uniref:hypothetical protein n=1 Tax=Cnuibacter physcomitrellae TaxID=1619308 RepID=UPI0021758A12|nr:hypothetical protein [Cnuibacter physcomitrellae]MCS5498254.1 hypothetical protein [Cnuibacter physcomitrellae]
MVDDIYTELARQKPIAPTLGGVYATLVQAVEGREEAYNRWYEDDHFVVGGMSGPWVFSGKRYSRPDLPVLRSGEDAPREPGSFITLYFALEGHVAETAGWIREMWHSLEGEGRGAKDRRHLYSAMHEVAFERVFDPAPMRTIHALQFPYRSLVVEFYDSEEAAGRPALVERLRADVVGTPRDLSGQCIALTAPTMDDDRLGAFGWATDILARRVCLLWFLPDDPATALERVGGREDQAIAPSYRAVFAPTLPGTPTTVAPTRESEQRRTT